MLVVLAAGLGYAAYQIRAAITPFALAAVLAFVLEPPVLFLERRRVPRLVAILVVYAAVGLLVAVLLLGLIPIFVRQLTVLAESLPRLTAQVEGLLFDIQTRYAEAGLPPQIRQLLDGAVDRAETRLLAFIQAVLSGLLGVIPAVLTLLLTPFLAFYFLKDRDALRSWFVSAMPLSLRGDTLVLLAEVGQVVNGFVRGQLLVAGLVGLLVGVVTRLLGLPFPAVLGVIAAATNIIPYFGPIIGGVPAVALALLEGPALAVWTVLALLVVQQVDNLLITPRLVGRGVGLHPLTVVFSLLAGAEAFGLLGILIAVPVAALVRVVLKHLFTKLVRDPVG